MARSGLGDLSQALAGVVGVERAFDEYLNILSVRLISSIVDRTLSATVRMRCVENEQVEKMELICSVEKLLYRGKKIRIWV